MSEYILYWNIYATFSSSDVCVSKPAQALCVLPHAQTPRLQSLRTNHLAKGIDIPLGIPLDSDRKINCHIIVPDSTILYFY